MTLGPTQPPIQWVPGALSLGVKQPGHEADHSSPSSAKVKECVELCLHSPNKPSWHGAQFKEEAQGKLFTMFRLSNIHLTLIKHDLIKMLFQQSE
jgi:hypothetical protein